MRRLAEDPYLAVVRVDDPLAETPEVPEVPLSDLAARRWVDNDLHEGACRQVLLNACAQAGSSPSFVVKAHDIGELPKGLTTVALVSPTPVRYISLAVKKSIARYPAARRTVEPLEGLVRAGKS
ncbi:hypothetical protein [Streptomyces sp. AM6-12]|uniref:hypothetical protein n=1 Tax=Streptomyces sp. AM6-12 TaxID=3345149 RepID=UPI0037AA2394